MQQQSSELKAFLHYLDDMKFYVNPSSVQGKFMQANLVDARTVSGGGAVFLPNHMKMESMLSQIQGSIAINGPAAFGALCKCFNSVPMYQKLARQLNEKYLEFQDSQQHAANLQSSPNQSNPTVQPTDPPAGPPPIPEFPIIDQQVDTTAAAIIASKVGAQWQIIGYGLGIEPHQVDNIKAEAPSDPKLCFIKMVQCWIESSEKERKPKTWRTFLIVLHELDVNSEVVVAELKKLSVSK